MIVDCILRVHNRESIALPQDLELIPRNGLNAPFCLATGTGSTSWTFNINKLTHQSVEQLLRIVYETTHFPVNWKDDRLVEAVTQKFNNEIVFDPADNKMAYTLRDPVSAGTFPGKASVKRRFFLKDLQNCSFFPNFVGQKKIRNELCLKTRISFLF